MTVGSDSQVTRGWVEELRWLEYGQRLREKGIGILITDHNVRETLAITDRAYIMREGQILASGSSEELCNNPLVRQYYLGDNFQL